MAPVWRALIATFAMQAWVVAGANVAAVIAPVAAVDFGMSPNMIGYYASIMNAGAVIAAISASGFVLRFGAIRTSQSMLVFCALGLALLATGSPALAILSAVVMGLGYGSANPPSSHLLARMTPAHMRARVFSLKQTSVPVGIAFTGLAVPALVLAVGWRGAALVVGGLALVLMLVFQFWRREFDGDRNPGRQIRLGHARDSIRLVLARPGLRTLVLASVSLSACQFCFTAFFVTLVSERVGLPPTVSGPILSLALVMSVGGRLLWGWAADRTSARLVLVSLTFGMSAASAAAALVGPGWSEMALAILAIAFGLTGISWNGVFLAETAALAPEGEVPSATGAAMFFTLLGGFAGPAVFAALVGATGAYGAGFGLMAAATFVSALMLTRLRRPADQPA